MLRACWLITARLAVIARTHAGIAEWCWLFCACCRPSLDLEKKEQHAVALGTQSPAYHANRQHLRKTCASAADRAASQAMSD